MATDSNNPATCIAGPVGPTNKGVRILKPSVQRPETFVPRVPHGLAVAVSGAGDGKGFSLGVKVRNA